MSPKRRLFISILVLAGVFVMGLTGYVFIEGVSAFRAAYFTLVTLSTVGYQQEWQLSHAGQLWTMFVIAFGIISASTALSSLAALFVSGEIQTILGSRKVQAAIAKLHDHVILCGFGRMGALAAEDLRRAGRKVVVIEHDAHREADLRESGFPFIIGDATDEDVLFKAGLERARALVTTLANDADNVYVTLTARSLNPDLSIIARAEQPGTQAKLRRAGAERVICPQLIGATRITSILTRPHIVDFFDVADKGVDLEMDEYVIARGSALCGLSLSDARIRQRANATVVAIKHPDGRAVFNPSADIVLKALDTLIIIGPAGVSQRLDRIGPREEPPCAGPADDPAPT